MYGRDFTVKSWIPALICILIALLFLWRAVGKFSDEYLRELYEEGLLVPGMIVKTEPLTIMAIANMVVQEGGKYHSSFQPPSLGYNGSAGDWRGIKTGGGR